MISYRCKMQTSGIGNARTLNLGFDGIIHAAAREYSDEELITAAGSGEGGSEKILAYGPGGIYTGK